MIFERGRRGVGAKRRLRGYRRERASSGRGPGAQGPGGAGARGRRGPGAQGPGGAAPGKFLTELYAKPIGLRISIQKVQSS